MGLFDKIKAVVSKDKKKKDEDDERRRRVLLESNEDGTATSHDEHTKRHNQKYQHEKQARSGTAQATGRTGVSSANTIAIPDGLKGASALLEATGIPATDASGKLPPSARSEDELLIQEKLSQREINREDFEPLAVLGKGTFASVLLVRASGRLADAYRLATTHYFDELERTPTASSQKAGGKNSNANENGSQKKVFWPPQFDGDDAIFAMKIVPKKKLLDLKRANDVFVERNVLAKSGEANPFVIKLRHTFQSENKLFFVMDYMAGGDMRSLINEFKRRREPMPYATVKLYATEIALALVNLHKNGILYRDLKPENILLDSDGHCYLADFGLSKDFGIWGTGGNEGAGGSGGPNTLNVPGHHSGGGTMRASSFVGSPMYVAPEVLLRRESYSTPVDFWSFGVILYTMLYGAEPFRGLNVKAIFDQILTQNVAFPPAKFPTPPEIIDLIAKLLIKDPSRRLNAANLFSHPFFNDVDLNAVKNKLAVPEGFILKPPPFAPIGGGTVASAPQQQPQQQPLTSASGKVLPPIPHHALLDANVGAANHSHETGHNDMYTPEHLNGNFRHSQQRLFADFGWCAVDDLLTQQELKEEAEEDDRHSNASSYNDDASSDGYDGESYGRGSNMGGSSAPPSPHYNDYHHPQPVHAPPPQQEDASEDRKRHSLSADHVALPGAPSNSGADSSVADAAAEGGNESSKPEEGDNVSEGVTRSSSCPESK